MLEAAHLRRYGALLADLPTFVLPVPHAELTTREVLAMSYVDGAPIESLATAPQPERDRVAQLLFDLLFREIFEFRLIQTDPNFANDRYDAAAGRVTTSAAPTSLHGCGPRDSHSARRRPPGILVTSAAAFVTIWRRLPGFAWLARFASTRPVLGALELGYALFLRARPLWRPAHRGSRRPRALGAHDDASHD